MKRSRRIFRWKLTILIIILGGLICVGYYIFIPRPQQSNIFLITNTSQLTTYGNTQLAGRLQKDSPVGKPGNFLLITSSSQAIKLNVQGLDKLLGNTVLVKGILSPATSTSATPTMQVFEVTVH